jgi:hypothetical protein
MLPRDYDPDLYNSCFEYNPNRSVYSLKQIEGLRRDNWRNYLPLNFKDFPGKVSTIKALNVTGAVMLFEDAEPIMFRGIDELQTESGTKYSVGDGGLFANAQQSIINADDSIGYGECTSSRSAVNTPYGLFWISQQAGKILHYDGSNVDAISDAGMKFWFNENLPSHMLNAFPQFPHYDNPVIGVGCQTIYDPQYELLYFMKKDVIPPSTIDNFNSDSDLIGIEKGINLPLLNTQYFTNASWVASYDPKSKTWISFHDWKPSLVMPSRKHFYTIPAVQGNNTISNFITAYDYTTGNTLWKHNDRWDDYCTYYGNPHYWEIEYPFATPNGITTLRSVEYTLDCYKFAENGKDAFHILDENFDRALIYNSEQNSGWLHMTIKAKNDPYTNLMFPDYDNTLGGHWNILYAKEENKFRFNQFWDNTLDRGEFLGNDITMFLTEANGVTKYINNAYIDLHKPVTERKKFRHYGNKVILRRVDRDAEGIMPKMVLKLVNNKLLNSPR